MILSRRIALRPSAGQEQALGRACGTARWAFNWGLAKYKAAWTARKDALDAGVDKADAPKMPTAISLHRELNALKKLPVEEGGVPWMYASSKCAPQEALRDLDAAFQSFFRRCKAGETPGYPRFKAKGRDPGHFRVSGAVKVADGCVHLPRIGAVRFMPGDRGYIPDGRYATVSVVEEAGRWFASVRIEVAEAVLDDTRPVVGLDAGVRELAHLSDGTVIPNPKALDQEARRLRTAKLDIARKRRAADKRLGKWKKGERRVESRRLQAARRRAARLARRVAHVRMDALHKATTWIARTYSVVNVEALAGKNMTRKRRGKGRAAKAGLNRAILDSGMLRLRSLLTYKMPLHGGRLELVNPAYTSRTCSRCGTRCAPFIGKTFKCESCGLVADRDHNASLNILVAASWPETQNTRGGAVRPAVARPAARSDETRIRCGHD
jgi:putative transposase